MTIPMKSVKHKVFKIASRLFIRAFLLCIIGALLIAATTAPRKPIIWVCGDSTATNVPDSKSKPPHYLMGWAQMLHSFFDSERVEVQNKARSGRSSKSFSTQIWPSFKNDIQTGDFVVIQFGHNDAKSDGRHTDPQTSYKQYLSLYIDHAEKVGATPILATSIVRNRWESDGKTMKPTHGNYPAAMRELAKEKNVTLVDLTQLTREYFEKIGQDSTTKTVFFPNDGSHLQKSGAIVISRLFVNNLAAQNFKPLCSWLKDSPCDQTTSYTSLSSNHDNSYHSLISYNSAKRVLYINARIPQYCSVTVLSLDGKSLLSKIFNIESPDVKMEIPLHELSRGGYFVKFEGNGASSVKFINVTQ